MIQQTSYALTTMSGKLYRNTRRTRYVIGLLVSMLALLLGWSKRIAKYIYKILGTRLGRLVTIIVACHVANYVALNLYVKYCSGNSGLLHLIMELVYGKNYYNPVCKQLLFLVYLTNSKVFSYLTGTHLLEYWFSRI